MKDATGELSMTAIAVVALAAIGVVFTQLVWPAIKKNITRSAHCSEAYGCKDNGAVHCGPFRWNIRCRAQEVIGLQDVGSFVHACCPHFQGAGTAA